MKAMKNQEIKEEVTETGHRKETGLITVFAKLVFTVIFLAIIVLDAMDFVPGTGGGN